MSMPSRKMGWLFLRAATLAALSYVYVGTAQSVEAACYSGCTVRLDHNGACIGVSCDQGETGDTGCTVSGCVCTFNNILCAAG